MPKSSDERKLLELLRNHAEFKSILVSLAMNGDLPKLEEQVHGVARRWFALARLHQADAAAAGVRKNSRAVYSRAYYAAYNASKAIRYVATGSVSLRGDDHKRVGDLPGAFPDAAKWGGELALLYEHRLRADYDNWSGTPSENSLSAKKCRTISAEFLDVAEQFLLKDYGLKV